MPILDIFSHFLAMSKFTSASVTGKARASDWTPDGERERAEGRAHPRASWPSTVQFAQFI
jgi:hypothetical protein